MASLLVCFHLCKLAGIASYIISVYPYFVIPFLCKVFLFVPKIWSARHEKRRKSTKKSERGKEITPSEHTHLVQEHTETHSRWIWFCVPLHFCTALPSHFIVCDSFDAHENLKLKGILHSLQLTLKDYTCLYALEHNYRNTSITQIIIRIHNRRNHAA